MSGTGYGSLKIECVCDALGYWDVYVLTRSTEVEVGSAWTTTDGVFEGRRPDIKGCKGRTLGAVARMLAETEVGDSARLCNITYRDKTEARAPTNAA